MALRTRTRLTAVLASAVCVLSLAGVWAVRADPSPSLPAVRADRLLASTLSALSEPVSISGTVQTKLDLGLPDLPAGLGGGAAGPEAALMGPQTFKVWRSPDGARLSHILPFGEQTLVANRTQAWSWDSSRMVATRLRYTQLSALLHQRLSGTDGASFARSMAGAVTSAPSNADVLAASGRALAALKPYADVSVDGTARVAGRPVYELVLTPRAKRTLVGRIVVSVDAQTRLPLRFQVIPKGTRDAAIQVGFSSVSFDAIDPSMFDFVPPAGATVKDADISGLTGHLGHHHGHGEHRTPKHQIFGSGFATRIAIRLKGDVPAQARALLPYAGPLASVTTVDRGSHTWLLFGFVGVHTLQRDASSLS